MAGYPDGLGPRVTSTGGPSVAGTLTVLGPVNLDLDGPTEALPAGSSKKIKMNKLNATVVKIKKRKRLAHRHQPLRLSCAKVEKEKLE